MVAQTALPERFAPCCLHTCWLLLRGNMQCHLFQMLNLCCLGSVSRAAAAAWSVLPDEPLQLCMQKKKAEKASRRRK